MICSAKRKVLDGLNKRYIYGRVVCTFLKPDISSPLNLITANPVVIIFKPLLHTIIFLVEMAVAARLATKFNTYYAERPGKPLSACSRGITD